MFAPMDMAGTQALVSTAQSTAKAAADDRSWSPGAALARVLASLRSRYWAWRLRRATRNVLDALDELTVLDIASCPRELASLIHEIESCTAYWRVAKLARTPAAGQASGHG